MKTPQTLAFEFFFWGCFLWIISLTFYSCANPSDSARNPIGALGSPGPYPTFQPQDLRGDRNFAHLINTYGQGKANPTPWAGYWWPYTRNGIAAGGFFDGLSPAGKYDAARGNSTQAQLWEVRNHGAAVPKVQSWWGHCNGWCAASALFPEPRSPVTVNQVSFNVGDLKAILSELGMSVNADFFGERIETDDISSPKFWDTVPNQYFLVLTHYMGKLERTVLMDRYTGSQVWNQPIAGYRFDYPQPSDYLGNSPDAPQVYRINVSSTIWWMDDAVAPDVLTPAFDFASAETNPVVQSRELRMELWVDAPIVFDSQGKIISSGNLIVTKQGQTYLGGAWKMGEGWTADGWPDYMWVPYSLVPPTDPDQDYVNPAIDANWVQSHLLAPGGMDDPSQPTTSVNPAPVVRPSGWPENDSFPFARETPQDFSIAPNPIPSGSIEMGGDAPEDTHDSSLLGEDSQDQPIRIIRPNLGHRSI